MQDKQVPNSPTAPSTPVPPPEAIPAAPAPANFAGILALQVGVVVIAGLYLAREVLIPITLAILLSFILAPLARLLRRARLGRVPSVLLAVVIALGIILAVAGVIGSQVAQLATHAPEYAATIQNKINRSQAYALQHVSGLLGSLGYRRPGTGGSTPRIGNSAAPLPPSQAAPAAPQPAAEAESPLALAQTYLSPVLSPLATLGIIFVVAIFVLLQKEDLRDRLIRLFGSTDLHRTTLAMDDAAARLSRYFLTQLAVNFCFGAVVGIGLFFIGVPNPVLWAIISGLLRFVPYVGSFISAALPISLAAAVDNGWSMAIWTAVLYVSVELLVSQAIEPVVYGHSTGLSPFAVIVSAIFWSWLWGPIGLILSMPLTLCMVVLGRHVERLEFLNILLGDQPALTPVQSFYQRILAGDADEAQDHAELLLKEHSLSSYYDDVALKGLQLAAEDAKRGVLGREQLERVKLTVNGLVEELATHEDVTPAPHKSEADKAGLAGEVEEPSDALPPATLDRSGLAPEWQGDTPVLCLAGRGPLDEAASGMLAQLLGKHGLGGRVLSYQAASREDIRRLEIEGIAMVCVSYLDISGSPSHLRYLVRRLRQRLPGRPILVGLWPMEDSTVKDPQAQAMIGADYYSTSLKEAVDSCVVAAGLPAGAALQAPAVAPPDGSRLHTAAEHAAAV